MITGLAVSWALHAVMAVAMSPAAMPETVGAASMGAMHHVHGRCWRVGYDHDSRRDEGDVCPNYLIPPNTYTFTTIGPHRVRTFLPAAIVVALSALAALGFAGPALAHVKVSGTDTTQGGYGVMTFRVPTESDTASTTELRVTLPEDSPIMSVSTQPKPGWTATVTKTNLTTPQKDDDGNQVNQYVSQVDWKADNPQAAIPPHQFDTFNLSVGPLPKAATLSLPAEQFYSDGSTVNWNQKAADGQAAPEHPTPVLTLASASSGQTATSASSAPHDSGATWPGIAGLVVAIIAVLLTVANFALLRRKS